MRARSTSALALIAAVGAVLTPTVAGAADNLVWDESFFPIPIVLENSGPVSDLGVEDQAEIIDRAVGQWNSVSCAAISMVYGGLWDPEGDDDAPRVLIRFVRPPERWPSGETTGYTAVSGLDTHDPTPGSFDIEVDLNAVDFEWADGVNDPELRVLDMESVVIHELGHVLGLPHLGCPDGGCTAAQSNSATMAERYLPDLGLRTLSLLDKVALCDKYWVPVSECGEDRQCGEGSECVAVTNAAHGETVSLCAEPVGELGDFCSGADYGLICRDRCVFLGNDRSEGYCSITCDRDQVCPSEWVCQDQATTSGPQLACVDLRAVPTPLPPGPSSDDGLCDVSGFGSASSPLTLAWFGMTVVMLAARRHDR